PRQAIASVLARSVALSQVRRRSRGRRSPSGAPTSLRRTRSPRPRWPWDAPLSHGWKQCPGTRLSVWTPMASWSAQRAPRSWQFALELVERRLQRPQVPLTGIGGAGHHVDLRTLGRDHLTLERAGRRLAQPNVHLVLVRKLHGGHID